MPAKKEKQETEIAVKQDTSLAKAGQMPQGISEMSREDIIIPRVKLLQALSPEVVECSDGSKRPGMLVDNITGEIVPPNFSPIFFYRTWLRFNPRDSKAPGYDSNFGAGDLIWQTSNANDPRVIEGDKFGPNGERPLATKFLCFLSRFEGYPTPIVVGFANTSLRAGQQLLTQLMMIKEPIYSRRFELTSKHVKNDKGAFYVLQVKPLGKTPEDALATCQEWYDLYSPKSVDVSFVDDTAQTEEKRPY
jgi:hypothetical protein